MVKGVIVVKEFWEEFDDSGIVKMVMIKIYGDIIYILIDRFRYKGLFLFGYRVLIFKDFFVEFLCV